MITSLTGIAYIQNKKRGNWQITRSMQPVFIIKPDVKRVCAVNVIKVAAAAAIIVAAVTYSKYLFDISIFVEAFELSTESLPDTKTIVANFVMGILLASLLTFVVSYLSVSKRQYIFYPDRLEADKNFMIFNVGRVVVPLMNIVSVRSDSQGEQKLFGMGQIEFELSGLPEKQAKLDNIRKPESYLPYIQRLIDNVKAQNASQYAFQTQLSSTLNRTI